MATYTGSHRCHPSWRPYKEWFTSRVISSLLVALTDVTGVTPRSTTNVTYAGLKRLLALCLCLMKSRGFSLAHSFFLAVFNEGTCRPLHIPRKDTVIASARGGVTEAVNASSLRLRLLTSHRAITSKDISVIPRLAPRRPTPSFLVQRLRVSLYSAKRPRTDPLVIFIASSRLVTHVDSLDLAVAT